MTEITIPQLGESIVEATIGHWLKKPGDAVTSGEPVLEIETDKVTMEVPAPQDGVLQEVRKNEGDTAQVGEVVGVVETRVGALAGSAALSAPATSASAADGSGALAQGAASPAASSVDTPPRAPERPSVGTGGAGTAEAGAAASRPVSQAGAGVLHSAPPPSVRRLAKAYQVEIEKIQGTGPHGQVTREDIEAAARGPALPDLRASGIEPTRGAGSGGRGALSPEEPKAAINPAAAADRDERVRMSRRRLTIARQLLNVTQQTAMLTTFNEIDMSAILSVRKERRDRFKDQYGVSLGFMSFFVRAVVGALKKFPRLNAEIQGEDMVLKHHYDIGIAVSTEEGLVVPVLREADRLNFAEIETTIAELAQRARKNALTLQDLRGGTFTITNGGVFGSLFSTPILNPPQVGILGMHAIQERPMAVEGHVEVRPMMYVALSYDHRIVDGSEAVRFLVTVKRLCEDPVGLLLEG